MLRNSIIHFSVGRLVGWSVTKLFIRCLKRFKDIFKGFKASRSTYRLVGQCVSQSVSLSVRLSVSQSVGYKVVLKAFYRISMSLNRKNLDA